MLWHGSVEDSSAPSAPLAMSEYGSLTDSKRRVQRTQALACRRLSAARAARRAMSRSGGGGSTQCGRAGTPSPAAGCCGAARWPVRARSHAVRVLPHTCAPGLPSHAADRAFRLRLVPAADRLGADRLQRRCALRAAAQPIYAAHRCPHAACAHCPDGSANNRCRSGGRVARGAAGDRGGVLPTCLAQGPWREHARSLRDNAIRRAACRGSRRFPLVLCAGV
jgi:hypothetical protein